MRDDSGDDPKRRRIMMMIITVMVLVLVAAAFYGWKAWRQRQREAAYERVLKSFSRDLSPGMTRKSVEDYLRKRGSRFTQICCVGAWTEWADVVQVGEESAPFYCSEKRVYIAFDFANVEAHQTWTAYDSDILRKIIIHRQLTGCL